jgi:hypothetical protein
MFPNQCPELDFGTPSLAKFFWAAQFAATFRHNFPAATPPRAGGKIPVESRS